MLNQRPNLEHSLVDRGILSLDLANPNSVDVEKLVGFTVPLVQKLIKRYNSISDTRKSVTSYDTLADKYCPETT